MRLAQSTSLVIAVALLASGCGGGDDESASTAAPTPTTSTSTPAPASPEKAPRAREREGSGASAARKRRLEDAGYRVIDSGVEGVRPAPEGALEFPLEGGGGVTVFVYDSMEDARTKATEFERLAKRYPDYFRVAVEGTTTYVGVAEQPEKLDAAAFDEAVARAEGR